MLISLIAPTAYAVIQSHMRPKDRASLSREVLVLTRVGEPPVHPNVVQLYDYFEDGKHFYLVMELCKGGNLFEKVSSQVRHTMTPLLSCGVLSCICTALFDRAASQSMALQFAVARWRVHCSIFTLEGSCTEI